MAEKGGAHSKTRRDQDLCETERATTTTTAMTTAPLLPKTPRQHAPSSRRFLLSGWRTPAGSGCRSESKASKPSLEQAPESPRLEQYPPPPLTTESTERKSSRSRSADREEAHHRQQNRRSRRSRSHDDAALASSSSSGVDSRAPSGRPNQSDRCGGRRTGSTSTSTSVAGEQTPKEEGAAVHDPLSSSFGGTGGRGSMMDRLRRRARSEERGNHHQQKHRSSRRHRSGSARDDPSNDGTIRASCSRSLSRTRSNKKNDEEERSGQEPSLADEIYARAAVSVTLASTSASVGNSKGPTTATSVLFDDESAQGNDGVENSRTASSQQQLPYPLASVSIRKIEPVRSLRDLRHRIEYAKSQRWVHEGKAPNLAAIRETLGLEQLEAAARHAAVGSAEQVPTNLLVSDTLLLPLLYTKFAHSLRQKGDDSPYVQYVINSSASEPEPALMMLQFLHHLDVLVLARIGARPPVEAPTAGKGVKVELARPVLDPQVLEVADEVAKYPTLACWCREILRYPREFPLLLLESCLCHLQRYSCILNSKERLDHVLYILFRGNRDRSALDELRSDLEELVAVAVAVDVDNDVDHEKGVDATRADAKVDAPGDDDKRRTGGFLILARAVYFYNSVERTVLAGSFAASSSSSSYRKLRAVQHNHDVESFHKLSAFQEALERYTGKVPDDLLQQVKQQLHPQCAGPGCFRRAEVQCCGIDAAYCSEACRDRGWKIHNKACRHGEKIDLAFPAPSECDPPALYDETNPMPSEPTQDSPQKVSGLDEYTRRRMDALKTPKTPKVQLDVIETFDDLRVNPLFSPQKSKKPTTEALLRQDELLKESPNFDYFLSQPWGKMGLQFDSLERREEFRELRRNAPSNLDDVEEMLEVLARCCPPLKPSILLQLETEYAVNLSAAAESPTRAVVEQSATRDVAESTPGAKVNSAGRPVKPVKQIIGSSLPKVNPRSVNAFVNNSSPWGIVMP